MGMKVIVVGGGTVGAYLGSLLVARDTDVRVVELREEQMPHLHQVMPPELVVLGNGVEAAVLEAAGIREADVVVAVTGGDEINLVICSLARFHYNVPRTIARVNNPRSAWLFTAAMGVDVALNEADLLAHLIAEEMSLGDMMTLLKLRKGQYSLVEEKVHPTARAVGRPVGRLELPPDCVLAAIIREGRLLVPEPETVLQTADEVLAVVHSDHVATLAALLGVDAA